MHARAVEARLLRIRHRGFAAQTSIAGAFQAEWPCEVSFERAEVRHIDTVLVWSADTRPEQ